MKGTRKAQGATLSDVTGIAAQQVEALRVIRDALGCPATGTQAGDALVTLETFVGVSLRLMSRSSPDMIRRAARDEEIRARLTPSENQPR